MTLIVTLSDDVANYLVRQSQALNKPCDQIANEILRRAMISEGEGLSAAEQKSNSLEVTGECLGQTLDDLYVEDYFEKMRQ